MIPAGTRPFFAFILRVVMRKQNPAIFAKGGFVVQQTVHPFPPVYDAFSRVLILGTMPSPKSRQTGFYYGNPQNRFWRVLCEVLQKPLPSTAEGKRLLALSSRIALWDVLRSCDIEGADDGSIRNPVANDLSEILNRADIRAIFTTGTTAARLYKLLCYPQTGIPARILPSPSPANYRNYSYEDLVEAYRAIVPFCSEFIGNNA